MHRSFFKDGEVKHGQRGRQRAILREGVYAINLIAVHRHDRGHGLPAGPSGQRRSKTSPAGRSELWSVDGFRSGGDRRAGRSSRSAEAGKIVLVDSSASSPCRMARASRPARSSPRPSATIHRSALSQQLPGPRGVPCRRRPPRPAVCPADRWHVLHQPLVCLGGTDAQNGRAHRLRRRGGQLLRPIGARRVRRSVPPRRARRRRRTRRLGNDPRSRQISFQHLCRQHDPGADDQLRVALDHRQERDRIVTTKACDQSTW